MRLYLLFCWNSVQRKVWRPPCGVRTLSMAAQWKSFQGYRTPNLTVYLQMQRHAKSFLTRKLHHCLTLWWRPTASDMKVTRFSVLSLLSDCYALYLMTIWFSVIITNHFNIPGIAVDLLFVSVCPGNNFWTTQWAIKRANLFLSVTSWIIHGF